MSELWCKTCGAFIIYPGSHTCLPRWECWHEDDESREHSARMVDAYDAEAAATLWAELGDQECDYGILDGTPAIVCVVSLGAPADAKPLRFEVTGRSEPEYSAEALEDEVADAASSGEGGG